MLVATTCVEETGAPSRVEPSTALIEEMSESKAVDGLDAENASGQCLNYLPPAPYGPYGHGYRAGQHDP